jgi:hypothetical protein
MPSPRVQAWFFFLCAGEGVIALARFLSIPSEGGFLSPARLVLIPVFLILILGWLYLGSRVQRVPRGLDVLSRPSITWIAALLSLTFGLSLFLLRYLDPDRFLPYYERLSPLLWYLFLLSLQITFLSLLIQNGFHPEALQGKEGIYASFLVSFCILSFVLIFVSVTKLGITKDAVYWGEPGVPIPAWLFAAAILIAAGFLYYESKLLQPDRAQTLNILLALLIWLAAAVLWLLVPISTLKNSFYAPITPPSVTPFPYSDAGFYDYLAQSLLIGTDYLGDIPARPLYVTFLAFLHFLFGQDYVKIIAAQTLVLALFPVALYWLGARIHSRSAGVVIASFAIFRELSSLWISSDTRTSVTKMFLTDIPTALFIVVVCLLAMSWLERRDTKSALMAGGAFGLLLLLRTQSLLILPGLFVLAWFVYGVYGGGGRRFKEWVQACLIFCAMLALTIAPWMIRNYVTAGQFALDYMSPTSVLYSQLSGETDLTVMGAERVEGNQLLALVLKNPGAVSGPVLNHFLNTQIGGLLALPLIAPFDGLLAPIQLYWMEWDGTLAWYNLVLVILYLAVIAMGMSAAWHRLRWIGLTPLAFNLGYALSNGIARFSSWRYNLPVDWVAYFYFGIGVIEILLHIARLFGERASEPLRNQPTESRKPTLKLRPLFLASAFVLVGALPWMAEGMVSPRYTDQSASNLEQELEAIPNAPSPTEVRAFTSQPEAFFEMGRLLYPRFFTRGKGIASSNPWPAYQIRDYPRFGFLLLNDDVTGAVFASREAALTFPHAADAIILGCKRADHVEVRLIAFPELDILHTSAPLTEPCSP